MKRRRRLNPTEEQERRAAAAMRAYYKRQYTPETLHTASADYDAAIDLANRILAGEEVADALSGTGLVVDMSPQPAQIAEIETSQGVVEVPVREAAPTTVVNFFKVETFAPGAGFKQLYRQRRGSRTAMGFDTLADAVKEAEHTLAIGDGDGYDVQTVRILRVDVDPETEEEIPNTGTVVWESSSRTSTPAPVVEQFPGSRRPSSTTPVVDPSGVWQFSTFAGSVGGLLDAFRKFNYTEGLLSDYLHSLSDAEVKKVAKREVGGVRGRTKAELIDALVAQASKHSRRGSTFLSRKPSVYP